MATIETIHSDDLGRNKNNSKSQQTYVQNHRVLTAADRNPRPMQSLKYQAPEYPESRCGLWVLAALFLVMLGMYAYFVSALIESWEMKATVVREAKP